VAAGEALPPHGRCARCAPSALEADQGLPSIGGGVARAPEAGRARARISKACCAGLYRRHRCG
jgi:hypothetical protein